MLLLQSCRRFFAKVCLGQEVRKPYCRSVTVNLLLVDVRKKLRYARLERGSVKWRLLERVIYIPRRLQ